MASRIIKGGYACAVIPSSWLGIFPWDADRLIYLHRVATGRGLPLDDLNLMTSLWLSIGLQA